MFSREEMEALQAKENVSPSFNESSSASSEAPTSMLKRSSKQLGSVGAKRQRQVEEGQSSPTKSAMPSMRRALQTLPNGMSYCERGEDGHTGSPHGV